MSTRLRKALSALLAALLLASSAAVTAAALEPSGNGVKIRNWVTNDPNYSFSEAYKTSVWYENFTSLRLTANQRNNVLRVAVSQLGYHEGNSAKEIHGRNTSGSGNYIEYARLIVPYYNDNHYEWCACFVNWCLNQAHIDYAYGEIGCWKWVEWLKSNKMFQNSAAYKGKYTPQPADMIFFNWSNVNSGADHIGYVLYVTDTTVYTIEGNSKNNNVAIRSYGIKDPCIIGYGTPPYDEGGEPTIDFSLSDGLPFGVYVVSEASVSLTDSPAKTKKLNTLTVGTAVTVTGTEGKYARVRYGDVEGYIPTKSLCLMTLCATGTFRAGGEIIEEVVFDPSSKILVFPEPPVVEGYTGAWKTFDPAAGSFDTEAVYTPIEYKVTFMADGEVVGVVPFTLETTSMSLPKIPDKPGFIGEWPPFSLTIENMTVEAVYTPAPPTEAPTEPPTDPATEAVTTAGTDAETRVVTVVTGASSDTEADTSGRVSYFGCRSSASASLLPLLGAAYLMTRKKHD